MKKIALSIFLLIAIISNSTAQGRADSVRSMYGFNIGLEHYQVKEHLINGLNHKGMGLMISGVYIRSLPVSSHKVEIRAGMASLKTSMEVESESFLSNFQLIYHYNHRLVSMGPKDYLSLGGLIAMHLNQGIYQNWDENHFYWLTTYCIGFEGLLIHNFSDKSRMVLEFNFPIIDLVSRTPAERRIHEDNTSFDYVLSTVNNHPVLTSWPDHFAMDWKLGYTLFSKRGIQQTIFWQIEYINNQMPDSRRFTSVGQTFGFEILF